MTKKSTARQEWSNFITENIPEVPSGVISRMSQYLNTRSAYTSDWHPNGDGVLIATRFGNTQQFHYIKTPGGVRKQITFFEEPVISGSFSPNFRRKGFTFLKDIGGSESRQVFFFDWTTKEYSMLTDGVSNNGSVSWSNKGDKFVYSSTRRNGKDWDLYLIDPYSPKSEKLLLRCEGAWGVGDWSPDDKKLLVYEYISVSESRYYILNVKTGKKEQVNPGGKKVSYGGALWSEDGKGIFIVSDEGSEFRQLHYYDVDKGKFTPLTKGILWGVVSINMSKQRDKLAFVVNRDGIGEIHLMNTRTKKHKKLNNIPKGLIYMLRFHPNGNRLAFTSNNSKTPGDVYVIDINTNKLERWTEGEVGGLDTNKFIGPKLIKYKTFDKVNGVSRKIPAFYYKPPKSDKPHPVLIDIHGGPEGQSLPRFNPINQYFLNEMGIAVVAPNVRGSSGYGKTYLSLDNGFKREDSVKDIGRLLNWIKEQPELDEKRVAVTGGSYGGYMVLASMIHYGNKLKAGIDIVGISNFVTFLENTKSYRRDLRREEYGDERNPKMRKFLLEISPLTNAFKIKKPMLVVHGINDPRVPVAESEQIVKAIRKNKMDAWYLLAKNEGHGFSKKDNRDYLNYVTVLFLEKFLLGKR